MKQALAAAGLALIGVTGVNAAANAAPAEHDVYVESYDGSEHSSAEDNPCGPWAMTVHEVRSGSAKLLAAPGGQVDGEFHVNGAVDGLIEIEPDDPALPSYTGRYREKINGIVIGFDEEAGDIPRVAQYRLRVPLTGSDGSTLVLKLSGKVTLNAHGDMVVARDEMTCS